MPMQIKTQKVPSAAVLQKKKDEAKAAKKAAKAKKAAVRKHREVTAESILFGSDLFEPIARKEREIVVRFGERFTHNRTRISLDGKFAFRATNDFFFELYYLIDPVLEYKDDFVLQPTDKNWLFDRLTVEELEDLIIKIVRAEFTEEKCKLLEELKKQDKERQLELDKADEEFLKEKEEENERSGTDIEASFSDTSSETSGLEAKTQENGKISTEKPEEKENSIPIIAKKEVLEEKKNFFIPTFKKR